MAPLPPPADPQRPLLSPALPSLHLQVHDVTSQGSARFFSHTSSPSALLTASSLKVLSRLYPPSLPSNLNATSPSVRSVTLFLRPMDGVAHTNGSQLDDQHKEVHLSSTYVAGVGGDSKRIRDEIEGVVVHELVHVYQWNGRGSAPGGVIEGIADWVRLQENLGPPHWKIGSGDRWDQGYDATAFFLDHLSQTLNLPLLVPVLNALLRDHTWDNGALLRSVLGGRDVNTLWKEYKEFYRVAKSEGVTKDEGTFDRPGGREGKEGYDVAYV